MESRSAVCKRRRWPRAGQLHGFGKCSAFTLAEVIAAIAVIGIGVLGIAALHLEAVRTSSEGDPRAKAVRLADEMANRIEANTAGRAGYLGSMGVVCDPTAKPKQPDDAAAQEAACWQDEVEKMLLNGLGTIMRDQSTSPVTYVVAVSWSAPQTGAASYVTRVRPKP